MASALSTINTETIMCIGAMIPGRGPGGEYFLTALMKNTQYVVTGGGIILF